MMLEKSVRRIPTSLIARGHKCRPWCLRWRTTAMPCSAFWYYRTRGEAYAALSRMR